ncbi:MAG TPA: hypothetical protein VGN61_05340 [Verrucomicrobiae bacterium]|jgi:hypothetical protein
MKKQQRPFLSLLTVLLGIRRFGPIPLLLWLGASTVVYCAINVMSSGLLLDLGAQGRTSTDFLGSQIGIGGAFYLFLMVLLTSILLEFMCGMPGPPLIEFFFTRAMDRGLFLRAQRMAHFVVLIGPMLLNLAISPFVRELDFGSEGIHLRHEPVMFAAWMTWAGILCLGLVAAYHFLIMRRLQKLANSGTKLKLVVVYLAIYGPLLAVPGMIAFCTISRINIYEQCFWMFANHLWLSWAGVLVLACVVEPLSERGLRKLEYI